MHAKTSQRSYVLNGFEQESRRRGRIQPCTVKTNQIFFFIRQILNANSENLSQCFPQSQQITVYHCVLFFLDGDPHTCTAPVTTVPSVVSRPIRPSRPVSHCLRQERPCPRPPPSVQPDPFLLLPHRSPTEGWTGGWSVPIARVLPGNSEERSSAGVGVGSESSHRTRAVKRYDACPSSCHEIVTQLPQIIPPVFFASLRE